MKCEVKTDDITAELSRRFDYKFDGATTFNVPQLEIPDDFSIGLIVGPSGSGKSSLLRAIELTVAQPEVSWDSDRAIVSHFSNADDAMERLSAVGLNSVPTWMKPFRVLSNGEQFRADLARRIGDGMLIDEFTSVIDRNVAKSCSTAVARYIRKKNIQRAVFASCHYDIVEWLQPDWVFDTASHKLTRGRLPRPPIVLDFLPCSTKAWAAFHPHHYLTATLNKVARCWLVQWGDAVVGFVAAIPFPHGSIKNAWREHRTVVLPDFQGMGIGVRISDAVAAAFVAHGHRYYSQTAHPRMGEYREHSPLWRGTSSNKIKRSSAGIQKFSVEWADSMLANSYQKYAHRITYSHEYIGNKT